MVNSKGWSERTSELVKDKHVRAQVKRVRKVMKIIQGTRDVRPFREILSDVAQLIATLELNPEAETTACMGGITVTRGPHEGYGIHLWASTVYVMRMGDLAGDASGGKWRRANEFWKAGREAQVAKS